jgi:ferredoxin-type protein NapF
MEKQTSVRASRLRVPVRLGALIAAAALVPGILPWSDAPLVVPALSPFVALGGALGARSLGWIALWSAPLLVVALWRRRWFCRWACPTGWLAQGAGRFEPRAGSPAARCPPLGQWAFLATLAGAALGYPLLLWMDPLAVFAAWFALPVAPLRWTSLAAAAALPVVVLLSVFLPGLWCGRLCPLGAMQDWLALPRQWLRRATDRPRAASQEQAVPSPSGGWRLARRGFLAGGIGLGLGWLAARRAAAREDPELLRPPGAADERNFAGLCVRCGNCVRACPSGIIHPDTGAQGGLAGWLAPLVRFAGPRQYCREDCHACTQVCPSGAIARLPLEEKNQSAIGRAEVIYDVCYLTRQRECSVCRNACPYEAISIQYSDLDFTEYVYVDAAKCPGCGACQAVCPTEPKAIVVRRIERAV